MKKISLALICLLIIGISTFAGIAYFTRTPFTRAPETPAAQAVTFILTSTWLVVVNNGTTPLEPFNFTVYIPEHCGDVGNVYYTSDNLSWFTNTTLAPGAWGPVIPFMEPGLGWTWSVASAALDYNGTVYSALAEAATTNFGPNVVGAVYVPLCSHTVTPGATLAPWTMPLYANITVNLDAYNGNNYNFSITNSGFAIANFTLDVLYDYDNSVGNVFSVACGALGNGCSEIVLCHMPVIRVDEYNESASDYMFVNVQSTFGGIGGLLATPNSYYPVYASANATSWLFQNVLVQN
jgi:hypothetical protein